MLHRFEQFTGSIAAIAHHIHKIQRDEMEKLGLKGTYTQYLLALEQHPDGLTAAQLCKLYEADKGAVSRILSELEGHGLISRIGSSYRAKLVLTQQGRQIAHLVSQRVILATELANSGISNRDREIFYSVLKHFSTNIESISKTGLPEKGAPL